MKIRHMRWLQLGAAALVLCAAWVAPLNTSSLPHTTSTSISDEAFDQWVPAESWQSLLSLASW